jgi:hypothetical protein
MLAEIHLYNAVHVLYSTVHVLYSTLHVYTVMYTYYTVLYMYYTVLFMYYTVHYFVFILKKKIWHTYMPSQIALSTQLLRRSAWFLEHKKNYLRKKDQMSSSYSVTKKIVSCKNMTKCQRQGIDPCTAHMYTNLWLLSCNMRWYIYTKSIWRFLKRRHFALWYLHNIWWLLFEKVPHYSIIKNYTAWLCVEYSKRLV